MSLVSLFICYYGRVLKLYCYCGFVWYWGFWKYFYLVRRRAARIVSARLDRVLANQGFLDLLADVELLNLPKLCLDHSPIQLFARMGSRTRLALFASKICVLNMRSFFLLLEIDGRSLCHNQIRPSSSSWSFGDLKRAFVIRTWIFSITSILKLIKPQRNSMKFTYHCLRRGQGWKIWAGIE